MADIKATREVGDTLRFEETVKDIPPFSDTGTKTNADTIEITIESRNGSKEVDSQAMDKNSTGEYYFNWDTQGLDPGDYKVTIFTKKSDVEEKSVYYVRLTE